MAYVVVLRFLTRLDETRQVERLGEERLLLVDPRDDERVQLEEALPRVDRVADLDPTR